MQGHVEVTGLRELRRALRDLEGVEGTGELRQGLRDAAGIVATEAKMRANTFSFRASDTIRPLSSGTTAYVVGGKQILPWYGWADFGSRTPRTGNPRGLGPWVGSGAGPAGGRFIYPAIADKRPEVVEAIEDAVARAARRLGFDTDAT